MKYVVLDLEMCKVPKGNRHNFRHSRETIQIGAVLLDEQYEIIDKFSTYVQPEFGAIDSYIGNLTGIGKRDVKDAPLMAAALKTFIDWMPAEELRCVSWSDSDKTQIEHEAEAKNIAIDRLPELLENWIDCQKMFGDKMHTGAAYSLEEALIASDIYQEGRAHDGLTDAYNTALLFQKISINPDFELNEVYKSAKEENVEHLGFSMGELFSNIRISE